MENEKFKFSVAGCNVKENFEAGQLARMVEKFGNVETFISGKYLFNPEYCEKKGRGNYVACGEDNLFPQHLINIASSVPEHSAAIKMYTDSMAGNGFLIPSELSSNYKAFIANKEGETDLAEVAYKASFDINVHNYFALEIQWSKNGKNIAYINHVPAHKLRKATPTNENSLEGWDYCENWAKPSKYKPIFIPNFNPVLAKTESKQIYFAKIYSPATEVYSLPSYYPVLNWVLISYNIGLFHLANLRSGYKPSLIFSFGVVPEQDVQDKIFEELEKKYSGSENAGAPVLLFNPSADMKPEITVVQPNSNDQQYQGLIDIVRQEILAGHRITNPEILGIPSSKGINSSGNDMLVAEYRLQKKVIDQLQLFLEKHLNYLASFNGIIEPVQLKKNMDDEKFRFLMSLFNTREATPTAAATAAEDNTQQQRNISNQ